MSRKDNANLNFSLCMAVLVPAAMLEKPGIRNCGCRNGCANTGRLGGPRFRSRGVSLSDKI
jgi:hypothetical protein